MKPDYEQLACYISNKENRVEHTIKALSDAYDLGFSRAGGELKLKLLFIIGAGATILNFIMNICLYLGVL